MEARFKADLNDLSTAGRKSGVLVSGSAFKLNVDIVIQHVPRKTRRNESASIGAYNSEAYSDNGFCPARELR